MSLGDGVTFRFVRFIPVILIAVAKSKRRYTLAPQTLPCKPSESVIYITLPSKPRSGCSELLSAL